MAKFYSVQAQGDVVRLTTGGGPWPSGLRRANLGQGFYAWDSLATAELYRNLLQQQGVVDLQIVCYEISEGDLAKLRQLDLTQLGDEEVNKWMEKHSGYGAGEPHDWEYVIRKTALGTEHYFAAAVFEKLKQVP